MFPSLYRRTISKIFLFILRFRVLVFLLPFIIFPTICPRMYNSVQFFLESSFGFHQEFFLRVFAPFFLGSFPGYFLRFHQEFVLKIFLRSFLGFSLELFPGNFVGHFLGFLPGFLQRFISEFFVQFFKFLPRPSTIFLHDS